MPSVARALPHAKSVAVHAERRSTRSPPCTWCKHILAFLSRLTSHERENHLSGFVENRHRYSLGALFDLQGGAADGVEAPLTLSRFICRPPNHIVSCNILCVQKSFNAFSEPPPVTIQAALWCPDPRKVLESPTVGSTQHHGEATSQDCSRIRILSKP